MLEELKEATALATGGEWETGHPMERNYLYASGHHIACLSSSEDGYYIHDDGTPNEADNNAHLIALMCSESARNHIIAALEAYERGPTPEQVREACAKEMDSMQRDALGCREADLTYEAHAYGFAAKAIRALDLSKIGGE